MHLTSRLLRASRVSRWCRYASLGLLAMFAVPSLALTKGPTGRWLDWQQESHFAIEGDAYTCQIDTNPARLLLQVGAVQFAGKTGLALHAADTRGPRQAATDKPAWKVFQHQRYVAATSARARVNVWRSGPYFWDTRVLDIPLVPQQDAVGVAPLRASIQLAAQPDVLRITPTVTPEHGEQLRQVAWHLDPTGLRAQTIRGRTILTQDGRGGQAALLLPAGAAWDNEHGRITFDQPFIGSPTIVLRSLLLNQSPESAFVDDLSPLAPTAVQVRGGTWAGFDPATGGYVVRPTARRDAFSFEESYRNPARRMDVSVTLLPSPTPRSILLVTQSGVGNLEAVVAADANGFPLPLPVQVSKNFAGEMEEPDDTAFGDAYVPLTVTAGAPLTVRLLHLTQNWGQSPLKQVSSVRFFHSYWHLSTGASESTCYTQDWMDAGFRGVKEPTFLLIPDFRPLSGPMWPGQPQHGCDQFPGLLQYNSGTRLVYERTDFDSISPLLARFTMRFHTSDDAATATAQVMECPQTDEMRSFIRVRYEWHKPVAINGDARINFRLATMFEHDTPDKLMWFDAGGNVQTRAVKTDNTPTLLGETLAPNGPVISSFHLPGPTTTTPYDSLILVRSYRGQVGGETVDSLTASARFSDKVGSFWFTLARPALTLAPGDWIEMDLEYLPGGEPVPAWLRPQREREAFATTGRPRVQDVSLGTALADFPATLRANGGAAAFTLTGGQNALPVIVEDWPRDAVPLIWSNGLFFDRQIAGGDYYQVEPASDGAQRIAFVCPIRPRQAIPLRVTAAHGSKGIQSLTTDNGRLVITTPPASTLTAEVLRPLGPGMSRYVPDRGLWKFTGASGRAAELPMVITSSEPVTVACEAWSNRGGTLAFDAPATIALEPALVDADYTVQLANSAADPFHVVTERTIHVPAGGRVKITAPDGTGE